MTIETQAETPTDDQPSEVKSLSEHDADTAPKPDDDTGNPNAEAARYRTRLRETETERDTLAGRLAGMQRAEAERIAGAGLRRASDLWMDGRDVAELRDERRQHRPGEGHRRGHLGARRSTRARGARQATAEARPVPGARPVDAIGYGLERRTARRQTVGRARYRVGGPHKSADCLTFLCGPAGNQASHVAQGLGASPVFSKARRGDRYTGFAT